MVLSLPRLSCESSVSVKENPDRKKTKKKKQKQKQTDMCDQFSVLILDIYLEPRTQMTAGGFNLSTCEINYDTQ